MGLDWNESKFKICFQFETSSFLEIIFIFNQPDIL